MSKLIKISLLALLLMLSFSFVGAVLAQEDTVILEESQENDQIIDQAIALDEDIEAEDLGIGKPRILPDNPFYFLKNWVRNIRQAFAFRHVVKAELRERFANEKLIELKEMVKREKSVEAIKRAAHNYEEEIEKIKDITGKIKEKAQESPEVEKFLDKFVKHQILHQRVLQKLEDQVPAENMEKIREMREKHLETFGEVMTKLEDRSEKLKERLETKMEEIEGSKYKNFKNLEILSELEEIVPEQAKETIKKVQENTLMKFKADLEKMPVQDQERFGDYLEKISGTKENQVRVLENLRIKLKETPKIEQNIIQYRDKILERVKQKETEKPAVCITLWSPVCGKDGKTYSNACFAEVAGVEIDYKGVCKEKEELTCEEKCKSLGYLTGICRTWAISPAVEWGCRSNEVGIGETSNCSIRGPEGELIIGIGRTCCCQKEISEKQWKWENKGEGWWIGTDLLCLKENPIEYLCSENCYEGSNEDIWKFCQKEGRLRKTDTDIEVLCFSQSCFPEVSSEEECKIICPL